MFNVEKIVGEILVREGVTDRRLLNNSGKKAGICMQALMDCLHEGNPGMIRVATHLLKEVRGELESGTDLQSRDVKLAPPGFHGRSHLLAAVYPAAHAVRRLPAQPLQLLATQFCILRYRLRLQEGKKGKEMEN